MTMKVTIYSDGSSRGNPGPGGYGTVMEYVDGNGRTHTKELSGAYRLTTNNRMELLGAIRGLEALKRPCIVEMWTDSQYVVNAFNKNWIAGWQARGWKTGAKKPVKNPDLWKRLIAAKEPHDVTFLWVKGHAGHKYNERCDELATIAADKGPRIGDTGFVEGDAD